MGHGFDKQRREFLIRGSHGLSAAILGGWTIPGSIAAQNEPLIDAQFHLHPHYRSPTDLHTTLAKTNAALDDFVTEKQHDRVAAILNLWSKELLASTRTLREISAVLATDFRGSSLAPAESRIVRAGGALEVTRIRFKPDVSLTREAFLGELRSSLDHFSKIFTADFQVTQIETGLNGDLKTRVRYEFVGTGLGFHREQRAGQWDLEWQATEASRFVLRTWRASEEIRSRSIHPWFADIAPQALGRVSSYSGQMLRGVDEWRTVLDGASGIDIYGHNGVSVGDIDDDGFDDLYVCQPAGLPNRLYRNRGDGTFEDITEFSGVGLLENTACAIFADFTHQGREDLIAVRANGPLLFLNQGGGKFRLKPDAFQFANPPQGTFTGAAAADYDRDGWLDIYFCLYAYYQGTDQYRYPAPYYAAENGPPNFMMRNNRDSTFRDVTAQSGLSQNNTRYSFCCGWGDFNRDGWPDLYVVNDFGRKNLYRNNGDGTFTDVAPQTGVEDVGAGMSVCWFDYNNDGSDDLYVANMWTAAGERVASQESFQKDAPEPVRGFYRKHAMGNSLFRNQGGDPLASGSAGHSSLATEGAEVRMGKPDSPPGSNGFQDATAAAGVGMGRWAWSSDAWDFDHDGFADLYIANGMVSGPAREDLNSFFWRQVVANSPNDAKPSHAYEQGWNAINELIRADGSWSGYERNVFYVNNRDGTFSDVSGAVGMDFPEDGRSFALADFDHDGRQEVFLKNRNAPVMRILKNILGELPPAIAFRLRGTNSSRDAIGAAVTIETDAGRQTRFVQAGSGFLSQHSKEVFFGLGASQGPVRASIRWPSGLVQELHDLPPKHRVCVEEGADQVRTEAFRASPQGPSHHPLSPPHAKADRSSGAGEAQVSSEPERLPTTVETWLLSPVAAPDFSLPDLTGQARTLAALHGKPVLLSFWSKESASCQEVLKSFAKFERQW